MNEERNPVTVVAELQAEIERLTAELAGEQRYAETLKAELGVKVADLQREFAEVERLTEELQQVRSENGNAFVAGASWQLYVSTGFTPFGSEARAAEVEAQRRGYDFRPSVERIRIAIYEAVEDDAGEWVRYGDVRAEIERLTARLAEATELLRAVEWSSDQYHAGPNACPVCTGLIPYTAEPTDDWPETFRGGHGAHCRLAAWLAAQEAQP